MIRNLQAVDLSLLDSRTGQTHDRAGLNWGHRPGRRNQNESYIPVPARIGRTNFFPNLRQRFIVATDDGKSFAMSMVQQSAKSISTPDGNGIIGTYFRGRLGLPLGQYVTLADLQRYGRTDVTFIKADRGIYFLDFSV